MSTSDNDDEGSDDDFDDNNKACEDEEDDEQDEDYTPSRPSGLRGLAKTIADFNSPATNKSCSSSVVSAGRASSSEKKRKHVTTGKKRGRESNLKKMTDLIVAQIRGQEVQGITEEVIKTQCISALKSVTYDDLPFVLGELRKMGKAAIDTGHTEAINLLTEAAGDDKVYYDSLKSMSNAQLSEEAVKNDARIEALNKRNTVLTYMQDSKVHAKTARKLLKDVVVDLIKADDF